MQCSHIAASAYVEAHVVGFGENHPGFLLLMRELKGNSSVCFLHLKAEGSTCLGNVALRRGGHSVCEISGHL